MQRQTRGPVSWPMQGVLLTCQTPQTSSQLAVEQLNPVRLIIRLSCPDRQLLAHQQQEQRGAALYTISRGKDLFD